MAELLNKQTLWYKSKMKAFPGRMVVTQSHFSYHKAPSWALMFGALGALLAGSAKGTAMINDEISNLKFSKGRTLGKKNYMLVVTTPDGNSYEFLVDDKLMSSVETVIQLN